MRAAVTGTPATDNDRKRKLLVSRTASSASGPAAAKMPAALGPCSAMRPVSSDASRRSQWFSQKRARCAPTFARFEALQTMRMRSAACR